MYLQASFVDQFWFFGSCWVVNLRWPLTLNPFMSWASRYYMFMCIHFHSCKWHIIYRLMKGFLFWPGLRCRVSLQQSGSNQWPILMHKAPHVCQSHICSSILVASKLHLKLCSYMDKGALWQGLGVRAWVIYDKSWSELLRNYSWNFCWVFDWQSV